MKNRIKPMQRFEKVLFKFIFKYRALVAYVKEIVGSFDRFLSRSLECHRLKEKVILRYNHPRLIVRVGYFDCGALNPQDILVNVHKAGATMGKSKLEGL